VRVARILSVFLIFLVSVIAVAESVPVSLAQLLPDRFGAFRRAESVNSAVSLKQENVLNLSSGSLEPLAGEAEYVGPKGDRFLVELARFNQDAEAYEVLSAVGALHRDKHAGIETNFAYATAGFETNNQVTFFKGLHLVRITNLRPGIDSSSLSLFARAVADTLDAGEHDIPPLIKHLPDPDLATKNAVYVTRFKSLEALLPNQQVLRAVETGGDGDATLASYPTGKVLIVEFNTPQLASENDKRITAKIQELWKAGQVAPSAYRRIGNYSVFVFDAPDETSAKKLIDQVKYEQVVQWLGENPNILKEAQRKYVDTTLGVFIAVVKASGYALVGCLGIGGLIGALLFSRRRAQQRHVTAFSDAGGMLRLNLDELTPQTNPSRLLRDRN